MFTVLVWVLKSPWPYLLKEGNEGFTIDVLLECVPCRRFKGRCAYGLEPLVRPTKRAEAFFGNMGVFLLFFWRPPFWGLSCWFP